MYVGLRLLRILANQSSSLNQLINIYPKTYTTPETRFDVDESRKFIIIEELNLNFIKNLLLSKHISIKNIYCASYINSLNAFEHGLLL